MKHSTAPSVQSSLHLDCTVGASSDACGHLHLRRDAPADSNEGLSSLEAEVDASPLDVVKEDRNEFGNDVEDGGSPPSAAVSTPGGNELNPGERPGEKLLP